MHYWLFWIYFCKVGVQDSPPKPPGWHMVSANFSWWGTSWTITVKKAQVTAPQQNPANTTQFHSPRRTRSWLPKAIWEAAIVCPIFFNQETLWAPFCGWAGAELQRLKEKHVNVLEVVACSQLNGFHFRVLLIPDCTWYVCITWTDRQINICGNKTLSALSGCGKFL